MAEDNTMTMMMMDGIVRFLTGNFPYSGELQCIWMAIQGAVAVRMGPNKNGNLHWFHAFALSIMMGYAGSSFGFLWMGRPSSMLSSDLNMASCIIAFLLINYTPFDIGYKICTSLPVTIVTVSFAQLFRSLGIAKFATACFEAFKDNPSPYYPIPVFGPIIYATLLGNMGPLFIKGFEGHLKDGMPWPVQNGIFCATFYHFYAHDKTGPIGKFLRNNVIAADWLGIGNDPKTFATAFIGLFMQVCGILQIPAFLGPSFTPFCVPIASSSTKKVAPAAPSSSSSHTPSPPAAAAKQKTITSRGLPAVSTARAEKVKAITSSNTRKVGSAAPSSLLSTAKAEKVEAVAEDVVGDAELTTTRANQKRKKKKKTNKQKDE